MPRMDLDKIVLHKTVHGINCPSCGGGLEPYAPPPLRWWQRWRKRSRGRHHYQCATCRRRYELRQETPIA